MSRISLQMSTIAAQTRTLPELETSLDKLAEIGFRTVQLRINEAFGVKNVKRLLDERGMWDDSMSFPAGKLAENEAHYLNLCDLFETNRVRLDSIPEDACATAEDYRNYAKFLNRAGESYRKAGVKLVYHFHAFEFIRFGDATGIELLLAESDPEILEICPDTHWIQSGGRSCTEFLEQYRDRYTYVHCKDFGIGPRGEYREYRPILFAPVGEGNLNWKPILDICKANNVRSYAIEQDNCYGRDPFDCVTSSFNFLKKMGVDG